MESLGKFKIIKHKPKSDIVYPLIRLPQSQAHITGEVAHVFKTEFNGKPLYVVSLEEDFDGNIEVVQPSAKSDLEGRVEALEKKLDKSLEFENKCLKESGPAEIRTQDLRRVKATS